LVYGVVVGLCYYGSTMTRKQIQEQVDALAQQYIDRMRAAHTKRTIELAQQIEECQRQQELCAKRLAELDS